MGAKRCRECGAQLRLRSTSCPLCGGNDEADAPKASAKPKTSVVSVDDYQSDIRKLREELRRLRDVEAS
jgi:predicted amidophosphoribosyltransferase